MTTTSISTMIFIGNLTSIDNDESDWDTDNAGAIAGTYNSYGDLEVVDINNFDTDNDGAIWDDEAGSSDYVTYSQGGSSYTDVPDATILYNAVVTEADGSQHTIEVVVVQMTNGDTFVGDMQNNGTLDNLTIRSIELTHPTATNAAGYNTHQTTSNTTVCFTHGTSIQTSHGAKRIELIKVGDKIETIDDGPQPVRWIGSMLLMKPDQSAPIHIATNALGPNTPSQDLLVSPHHRVLLRSHVAMRMFGKSEVLVAAKSLLKLDGVAQAPAWRPIRYWHMLFDRHQLIKSHGAVTESLLPAEQTMAILPKNSVNEIYELFPSLRGRCADEATLARPCPSTKQQRKLLSRHVKNQKSVQPDQPSTRV